MIADTIRKLMEEADILVNGSRPWDIQVQDDRWYARVWRDKELGLGESYMDGWWHCKQLDEMICKLLRSGVDRKVRGSLRYLLRLLPSAVFNLQSRLRSRIVAKRHYDLGNDLFFSFLDTHSQYSCGYFEECSDLEEAQRNKLDLIASKLELSEGENLLDIGCGWGGLAEYAADNYGCNVMAVNISREQLRQAKKRCKGKSVACVNKDYRSIKGEFDKIVSVGMFEHVGVRNYRTFMRTVHRCLKDSGVFLLHTIGGNESRKGCNTWINKYIFPNGMLPSVTQIAEATEGLFVMEDWHNLGPHYDKTLMAWNERFQRAWPKLARVYGERFKRMWEYYLLSCAGAFRARDIQLWQIVMTKCGTAREQPSCRGKALPASS